MSREILSILIIFPSFRPYSGQSEPSVEKEEQGEDHPDLFGKMMKTLTDKQIGAKKKIKQDDCNGKIC